MDQASVSCNITLNYDGIMTLNGLKNGYAPPVSDLCGNPPVALSHIEGSTSAPPTVTALSCCGGSTTVGYTNTVYYNLPDGCLLIIVISVNINQGMSEYYIDETKSKALIHVPEGLYSYCVASVSYDGSDAMNILITGDS